MAQMIVRVTLNLQVGGRFRHIEDFFVVLPLFLLLTSFELIFAVFSSFLRN